MSEVYCEHVSTLILRSYVLPHDSRRATRRVRKGRIHGSAQRAITDRIAGCSCGWAYRGAEVGVRRRRPRLSRPARTAGVDRLKHIIHGPTSARALNWVNHVPDRIRRISCPGETTYAGRIGGNGRYRQHVQISSARPYRRSCPICRAVLTVPVASP